MSVAVGVGLTEFPFASTGDYWRWVDLCEAGGIDSIWQTDRLVSTQPILECMAVMAALAGRTRRLRFGMNVVSLALRDLSCQHRGAVSLRSDISAVALPESGTGQCLVHQLRSLHGRGDGHHGVSRAGSYPD